MQKLLLAAAAVIALHATAVAQYSPITPEDAWGEDAKEWECPMPIERSANGAIMSDRNPVYKTEIFLLYTNERVSTFSVRHTLRNGEQYERPVNMPASRYGLGTRKVAEALAFSNGQATPPAIQASAWWANSSGSNTVVRWKGCFRCALLTLNIRIATVISRAKRPALVIGPDRAAKPDRNGRKAVAE
jgi:hypothetical protein